MASDNDVSVEMQSNPILFSEQERLTLWRNRLSDSNKRTQAVNSVLDTAASETLKNFEYWLRSVAINEESLVGLWNDQTIGVECFTEKIVGTMSFLVNRSSSNSYSKSDSENVRSVEFFVNWTQSWNNIMIMDGDFFGEENSFFKLLCEFYFHGYVMAFVSIITLYMVSLYIVAIIMNSSDANIYLGSLFGDLILLGAYIWGGLIYKGNLNFDSLDMGNSRFAREKIQLVRRNVGDEIGDAGLIELGSAVIVKSYQDGDWVRGFVTKIHSDGNSGPKTGWTSSLGFKEEENMMTFDVQYEFDPSTTETRVAPKYVRIRDKRCETPVALIFTMLKGLFNVYFDSFYWIFCCGRAGNIHAGVNIKPRTNSPSCEVQSETRGSLGGHPGSVSTDMAKDFRFYKNEILEHYRLTPMECGYWEMLDWSMKYMHLCGDSKKRFVQFSYHGAATFLLKLTILLIPGILAVSQIASIFDKAIYNGNRIQYWNWGAGCEPKAYCQANMILFWGSLGYFLSWLAEMMLAQALLVIFVGLLYGCDAVYRLMATWQSRFGGLRRIGDVPSTDELGETAHSNSHGRAHSAEDSTSALKQEVIKQEHKDLERMMLLAPLIRRDAYERYLIMHHFINELSSVWSSFLFFTLLLSLISTGLSYYLLVNTAGNFFWLYIFAIVIETTFFVFPVWCLVHANKHVYIIKNNFSNCTVDDFKLLGDNDEWIEFSKKAPLQWTIMGIPITQEVLVAYYSAAISTAPIVMTIMLNLDKYAPFA